MAVLSLRIVSGSDSSISSLRYCPTSGRATMRSAWYSVKQSDQRRRDAVLALVKDQRIRIRHRIREVVQDASSGEFHVCTSGDGPTLRSSGPFVRQPHHDPHHGRTDAGAVVAPAREDFRLGHPTIVRVGRDLRKGRLAIQSDFVQCELVRRRAGAGFRRIYVRGDTDFTQTRHLDAWDTEGVTFLFGILGRAGVVVRLPRTKGFYRATTSESDAPTFPGGSALGRLALR